MKSENGKVKGEDRRHVFRQHEQIFLKSGMFDIFGTKKFADFDIF